MPTIALTSAKQGPGTTVAALALATAWSTSRPTLLAELDCDGGDLISSCGLTTESNGLVTLAVDGRHGDGALDVSEHTQPFAATDLSLLTGSPSQQQMEHALAILGSRLPSALTDAASTVVIDAGRFRTSSPVNMTLRAVDLLLVVMRPTVIQTHAISARLESIKALGPEVGLLLVGEQPHSADEVQTVLDTPVVGVLAHDLRGVELLVGGNSSRFARTSLLTRTAQTVADHVDAMRFQRAGAPA